MARTRVKKLSGQRYALYVDGKYYASGSYGFVKDMRRQFEPRRLGRKK
jgi:hypothetical protein